MKFITTPSHGYLELTHEELITTKFMDYLLENPSAFKSFGYGYATSTHTYLEEDCEAPIWLNANDIKLTALNMSYSEDFDIKRELMDSNSVIIDPIKNRLIELVGRL